MRRRARLPCCAPFGSRQPRQAWAGGQLGSSLLHRLGGGRGQVLCQEPRRLHKLLQEGAAVHEHGVSAAVRPLRGAGHLT